MHIDQARALKSALEEAIDQAEKAGTTEVTLHERLDAQLAEAIEAAQSALDAESKGG